MNQLQPVTDGFIVQLAQSLPASVIREVSPSYLTEQRGIFSGQAGVVLAPENTQQVAEILGAANDARIGVIPYSGGTGLVGGQLAEDLPNPIILSTERMTQIRGIYPDENVMIVEAGAILADIRKHAHDNGRDFPLLLASEGSARIGGNLATNAGGMNVLRYGNTRDLCLGVEAVLADGTIIHDLKRLRKDNTGYDIRNLLIGSEGTLGLITAATLRVFTPPTHLITALMVVSDPKHAIDLLKLARSYAGEMISIFEIIGGQGFEFIRETYPDWRLPFTPSPQWMVLMEIGAPDGVDGNRIWEALYEDAAERELIVDGIQAQSAQQRDTLMGVRELIPAANKAIGSISSHDISLPISDIPQFIEQAETRISKIGPLRINCFGHLGDGNLHYNVFPPKGESKRAYKSIRGDIADTVFDLVAQFNGSFSAEHGVGRLKVGVLEKYGDIGRLQAMRAIKNALDPNGIMNPGAVLRGR